MPAAYLLPDESCRTIPEYNAAGLGGAIAAAAKHTGREIVALIESSGLRSRDHAATSVGSKWRALAAGGSDVGTRYLVANGTDSEPGSFTDRTLVRMNPLAVIEGVAVAARALGAREAFIAIRHGFEAEYGILTAALAEAEMVGWLDRVSIKCVRTPEEYLVGDERALLECIEGRAPLPQRLGPDVDGLFSFPDRNRDTLDRLPRLPNPTAVESLETLVNVAAIVSNGASWFRSMGTPVSPGNLLCTITGDVRRHGVVEVELGRRLFDVIEEGGGGFLPTTPPKAVLSGVSSPVLTRSRLAAPLCWEGLSAVGANVGRAAFIVYGEPTDMVAVAHQVAAFLYIESCGLCPACKFGGGEVTAYLARLVSGGAGPRDVEAVGARLATVTDGRRCDLAQRQRDVVSSILRAFPGDVTAATNRSSGVAPTVLEHIVDIVDGTAVYSTDHARKRADWVVEPVPVQLTRW